MGDKVRCPHDGATCHHECPTEGGRCFRLDIGAALSTPWPGFPKAGQKGAPVIEPGKQLDS